jgi:hypothetical protein
MTQNAYLNASIIVLLIALRLMQREGCVLTTFVCSRECQSSQSQYKKRMISSTLIQE